MAFFYILLYCSSLCVSLIVLEIHNQKTFVPILRDEVALPSFFPVEKASVLDESPRFSREVRSGLAGRKLTS